MERFQSFTQESNCERLTPSAPAIQPIRSFCDAPLFKRSETGMTVQPECREHVTKPEATSEANPPVKQKTLPASTRDERFKRHQLHIDPGSQIRGRTAADDSGRNQTGSLATSLITEDAYGSCFYYSFDSTPGITKGVIGYRFVCSAEALWMARQFEYLPRCRHT